MNIRSGFRVFEVYDKSGKKIKEVYTKSAAWDMQIKGYTLKIKYVKQ